jgi:hypothetical protein
MKMTLTVVSSHAYDGDSNETSHEIGVRFVDRQSTQAAQKMRPIDE